MTSLSQAALGWILNKKYCRSFYVFSEVFPVQENTPEPACSLTMCYTDLSEQTLGSDASTACILDANTDCL